MFAASISYIDADGPVIRVGFNLTTSGTYTNQANGGDKIPFTTASQGVNFVGMVPAIEALGAPLSLDVWDAGGDITTIVAPVLGTTINGCSVMLGTALGSEVSNGGAYPASIKTLIGEAVFNKL